VTYKSLAKRTSELQDLVGKDEDSQWKNKTVLPSNNSIKSFDDFFGWLEGVVYAVGVIGSFDWQVAGEVHCQPHLVRSSPSSRSHNSSNTLVHYRLPPCGFFYLIETRVDVILRRRLLSVLLVSQTLQLGLVYQAL